MWSLSEIREVMVQWEKGVLAGPGQLNVRLCTKSMHESLTLHLMLAWASHIDMHWADVALSEATLLILACFHTPSLWQDQCKLMQAAFQDHVAVRAKVTGFRGVEVDSTWQAGWCAPLLDYCGFIEVCLV